jgi:hypothetical protein
LKYNYNHITIFNVVYTQNGLAQGKSLLQQRVLPLLPQKYLLFKLIIGEEIFLLDPKANIRRIFEGQVLFEHNELELLTKFEEFLTKAHFNDFPKWSQPAKLRMLYATKFKFDKSLVIMNNYTSWKQKSLPPKETPQAIDFLVTL